MAVNASGSRSVEHAPNSAQGHPGGPHAPAAGHAGPARRIVVIGGGMAGLAAAHRAATAGPPCEVVVLEASGSVGGMVASRRQDGFLIEHGPDGFITNIPWAVELCRTLGIADQLLPTNPAYRTTFVLAYGRLRPIPEGFAMLAPTRVWPIVTTGALGLWGKLRLACEPLVRPNEASDESVAAFARRRLGRAAYQRLVQPLVGSMHTGDPEQLSIRAILPRFVELERQHGSLVRALRREQKAARGASREAAAERAASGARYSLFVAPREGMQSLTDALAAQLPSGAIRLHSAVERIERRGGRWRVLVAGAPAIEADGLILATPAPAAAKLLAEVDTELASWLGEIPHARCAVVSLGYRRDQIVHPLDGFGFVVPAIERRKLLSCSFASVKYAGRSPEGSVLLRAFVGGVDRAELLDRTDDELQAVVEAELAELLGVRGRPVCCAISRPPGMPQYYLGHVERIERMRARTAALGGLELAGNEYDGVGIPQCIRSGQLAAERLLGRLAGIRQESPAA